MTLKAISIKWRQVYCQFAVNMQEAIEVAPAKLFRGWELAARLCIVKPKWVRRRCSSNVGRRVVVCVSIR